jgi:GAF domain-containing protein
MDEVEKLRQYVNKLESSISKQQDPEYMQRCIKELDVLHIIGRQLQSLKTPEDLAQKIVRMLREIFGYYYGAILLIDRPTGNLTLLAPFEEENNSFFDKKEKSSIKPDGPKIGKGITGIVAQTGQSIRLNDVRKDQRYFPKRSDTLSEICVPMHIGDQIIGVINIESPELNAYTEDDQLLMETISSQVGVAIKNAQLYEELNIELKKQSQAKKALEQSEEKYRNLFDNISDFIYTHDLKGRFITVNRAALEIV